MAGARKSGKKTGLSRRLFLEGAGSLAVAPLAMPWVSRQSFAQAGEGEVVFAGLAGSIKDTFEKDIIPKFTSRTGIKVTYVAGTPNQVVAKLRAQGGNAGLDTMQLAGATIFNAIDLGLLQTPDLSLIPNASRINPKNTHEPQVIPFSDSGTALLYNKSVFEKKGWAPPTDWLDMWDPKYAGHVAIHGMEQDSSAGFIDFTAKLLTGDPNNLDAAFAKFKELRKNLYQIFPNPGASQVGWQQGDVWIGTEAFPRALQWNQLGMTYVGAVFPKSGVPCYDIDIAIIKGADHPKAAHAWINFLLDQDIQSIIVENTGYSPSTTGVPIPKSVQPFLPPDDTVWIPDWRKISKNFPAYVKRWQLEIEH